MPVVINYYEIVMTKYHDEIAGKIRYLRDFSDSKSIEESQLLSIPEINNLICCWRTEELKGSFGMGTILSEKASFQLVQE